MNNNENYLIEIEEKTYAEAFSINLDQYKIKDFKTRCFFIYSFEYKDNIFYVKKPFKHISIPINSIKYFSMYESYKNNDIDVLNITNDLYIEYYGSASKIETDCLILNLLKNNIPQIKSSSAYNYIKQRKLQGAPLLKFLKLL